MLTALLRRIKFQKWGFYHADSASWSCSYKKRWWTPAQLDRGYEPLLKREGTQKRELNTGGLVCTRWTKQLLSTFSVPSQVPSLHGWKCFMTMDFGAADSSSPMAFGTLTAFTASLWVVCVLWLDWGSWQGPFASAPATLVSQPTNIRVLNVMSGWSNLTENQKGT